MANPKYQSASQPPSAWAIVLVAAILILVPALFCTGIWLAMPPPKAKDAPAQHNEPIPKRQELNP